MYDYNKKVTQLYKCILKLLTFSLLPTFQPAGFYIQCSDGRQIASCILLHEYWKGFLENMTSPVEI